jgi:predicted nucleotidyltransferase component of viral defense system
LRLFEHRDFDQAVLQAAEHFGPQGLRPALIEKDYYVTEALRIIAGAVGDKVIFKGGTSLSKGWHLIRRFSEDVDIFLDPRAFDPVLGKNGIDRELKRLRAWTRRGHFIAPCCVRIHACSRSVARHWMAVS